MSTSSRSPRGSGQQTPLGRALAAAIAERGPITFADYMRVALYDPEKGYYTAGERPRVGWQGDFFTSVDLHPLFGAAVGRQLGRIWQLLGSPAPFIVEEDGAGRGLLARDALAWASDPAGDAPPGLAEALVLRQRDVGRSWSIGADQPEAPSHVVFSNELIDALPVHIVENTPEGLAEVYVGAAGDPPDLIEVLGPSSSEAVASYLDRFRIPWRSFPVGWRAEINLEAEEWIAGAAQRLERHGAIITIDYGSRARDLYTEARRRGTLLCFHRHEANERPLELTGQQDITAHVNFSALIESGRVAGLRLAAFTTQRDWLLSLGLLADAEALAQRLFPLADVERHTDAGQRDYLRRASLRNAIAALIDSQGLGGFRVLVQHRGLPGLRATLAKA
jgi:SAM-dependent MidA family methyltransferase